MWINTSNIIKHNFKNKFILSCKLWQLVFQWHHVCLTCNETAFNKQTRDLWTLTVTWVQIKNESKTYKHYINMGPSGSWSLSMIISIWPFNLWRGFYSIASVTFPIKTEQIILINVFSLYIYTEVKIWDTRATNIVEGL